MSFIEVFGTLNSQLKNVFINEGRPFRTMFETVQWKMRDQKWHEKDWIWEKIKNSLFEILQALTFPSFL